MKKNEWDSWKLNTHKLLCVRQKAKWNLKKVESMFSINTTALFFMLLFAQPDFELLDAPDMILLCDDEYMKHLF